MVFGPRSRSLARHLVCNLSVFSLLSAQAYPWFLLKALTLHFAARGGTVGSIACTEVDWRAHHVRKPED